MFITVEVNTCDDCRHLDHSGAFTPGGAKPVCDHYDAIEKTTQESTPERHHWKHRVVNPDLIPDWCPLKSGSSY